MPDELFQTLQAINDVYRNGILSGAELERSKIQQLEAENRELREHIHHLEDSLAVALGQKMGVQSDAAGRMDEKQRVPIIGPVKS